MYQVKLGELKMRNDNIPFAYGKETDEIYTKAFKSEMQNDLHEHIEGALYMDFLKAEKISWQVLWAHAKTANPKIPSVEKWKKKYNGISGGPLLQMLGQRLRQRNPERV